MLVLTLSLGLLAGSQGLDETCEFRQEFQVGMSGSAGADTLIVETLGERCSAATVVVRVIGLRNQVIIADAFALTDVLNNPWPTPEEARAVVESGIFTNATLDARDLPEVPDIAQSKLRADTPVPRWQPHYERARQIGGLLVCWKYQYEAQRCAWWDHEHWVGRILFEGGY